MPAKDKWGDEEDSSSAASSPKFTAVRRNKFEDEEGEDSDVLDSWDAAEDSEAEREKAKKAAEAKAKAEAEKKANKKTTAQRIAIHQANRAAAKAAAEAESSDEETENQKRDRLRRAEKDSDLRHAEDLFGDAGAGASGRKTHTLSAAIPIDPSDPNKTVDLSALPLFNPKTKAQLEGLNKIVTPLLAQNHKMPQYVMFVQELTKTLVKELPSDQVKKIASSLTALSNEKMKAEKVGEKTSKKKGKGKTSLNTTRNNVEDVDAYQDQEAFDDGDFM